MTSRLDFIHLTIEESPSFYTRKTTNNNDLKLLNGQNSLLTILATILATKMAIVNSPLLNAKSLLNLISRCYFATNNQIVAEFHNICKSLLIQKYSNKTNIVAILQ